MKFGQRLWNIRWKIRISLCKRYIVRYQGAVCVCVRARARVCVYMCV